MLPERRNIVNNKNNLLINLFLYNKFFVQMVGQKCRVIVEI